MAARGLRRMLLRTHDLRKTTPAPETKAGDTDATIRGQARRSKAPPSEAFSGLSARVEHDLDAAVLLAALGIIPAVRGGIRGAPAWLLPSPRVGVSAGIRPWPAIQSRTITARAAESCML